MAFPRKSFFLVPNVRLALSAEGYCTRYFFVGALFGKGAMA